MDRDTPRLLPVDLGQRVPENDLVHFVINAVETMKLPALSVNHGGDLAGFTLLRGDREKLNKLRISPEFESAMQRAGVVLSHFGCVEAFVGEEVQRRLADYQKQVAEWA